MWLADETVGNPLRTAAAATPPALVSGMSWYGITLQDWVYILTVVYLIMNITKPVWIWLGRKLCKMILRS